MTGRHAASGEMIVARGRRQTHGQEPAGARGERAPVANVLHIPTIMLLPPHE